MTDAWDNSADTTPAPGGSKGGDVWGSATTGRADRDPYKDDSTAAPDRDVRRSRSRSPVREGGDRGRGETNPGTNLHVSGLHPRVTDRILEDAFSKYGKVDKAQVVYDPHTRDSRCFAFVMMATLEEAEAAISGLSGYVLEGLAMRIDKARRGRARTPTPGRYFGPPKHEFEETRPYRPREHDYRYRNYDDGYYGRDYRREERGYRNDDRDYDRGYGRDRYRDFNDRRYEDDRGSRYGGRYDSRPRYDEDRGGRFDRGRYDDSRR